MHRRAFIAAATTLAATLAAPPAMAARLSLGSLSGYLNGIQTARSPFTQINGDGTISTGTVFLHRPGRMRFEYDAPDETLVMAGGGQVAIFDGKSNSRTPEQYPLARTPLKIILERQVDLGRADMVTGHREDGPKTIVTAQDPANPDLGSLEMVFTGGPVQLRQWVVRDGSGGETTVILGDLQKVGALPSRYFSIQGEIARRGR